MNVFVNVVGVGFDSFYGGGNVMYERAPLCVFYDSLNLRREARKQVLPEVGCPYVAVFTLCVWL